MHTIKNKDQSQIIHFNPDMSGLIVINSINPKTNVSVNGILVDDGKVYL